MKRRRLLAAIGTLATGGLAGCPRDGTDGLAPETPEDSTTQTPSPTPTETATKTPTPNLHTMHEGSTIVEVTVDPDFDGEVVLETTCREEDSVLEGGEQATVVRNEDSETCGVAVAVGGETAFDQWIYGYEDVTLTVTADGELEVERIEV